MGTKFDERVGGILHLCLLLTKNRDAANLALRVSYSQLTRIDAVSFCIGEPCGQGDQNEKN